MRTVIALASLAMIAIAPVGCASELPTTSADSHGSRALGADYTFALAWVDAGALETCGSTPAVEACVTVFRAVLTPSPSGYFSGGIATLIWNRARSTLCWSITLTLADPSTQPYVQVVEFAVTPYGSAGPGFSLGVSAQQTSVTNTGCVDVTSAVIQSILTAVVQDASAYQLTVLTPTGVLWGILE